MSALAWWVGFGHMVTSRIIILGVAVAAAGGAGYVAKNMVVTAPPQVVVESGPQQPAVNLSDVLVLDGDVPMGQPLGDLLKWQPWPTDATTPTYITRETDPEAVDKLKGSIARVPLYAGEPLRRSKLIGEGQSFMSSILPSGSRAIACLLYTSDAADE